MLGLWLCTFNILILGTGVSPEALMAQIIKWIENDTFELPTGSDFLCTEVSFIEKNKSCVMVIRENYFVRKTKRVAMTETRHVPLEGVKLVSVLENKAHPEWQRRFLILIQYAHGQKLGSKYLKMRGQSEVFGEIQAFTIGTYSLKQAHQIVSSLKLLCEAKGARLD